MNDIFSTLGFKAADILLPKEGIDCEKWAVVACDQYTSQEEYWESLSEYVGDSPSTLRLIYPEVYLEKGDKNAIISSINENMNKYLKDGIFTEYKDSFILVKRDTESGTRYGLMVALDLEAYSYAKDSKTLIRATEGTILSRIPPRKEIRKDAPIELPHIMVLISDKDRTVIEPLRDKRESLKKVYDTDLNKNGGHITGYLVDGKEEKEEIAKAFKALYDALDPKNPLLFAMGDGNHSLATAKSCWEDIKANLTEEEKKNHRARYALVELENIFDPGLQFEPIHRVFFNIGTTTFDSLLRLLLKRRSVFKGRDARKDQHSWPALRSDLRRQVHRLQCRERREGHCCRNHTVGHRQDAGREERRSGLHPRSRCYYRFGKEKGQPRTRPSRCLQ